MDESVFHQRICVKKAGHQKVKILCPSVFKTKSPPSLSSARYLTEVVDHRADATEVDEGC